MVPINAIEQAYDEAIQNMTGFTVGLFFGSQSYFGYRKVKLLLDRRTMVEKLKQILLAP
ncbi:hypothetical protein FPOAC2_07084 [Fusarium poae]|jgi:hypothetical protein